MKFLSVLISLLFSQILLSQTEKYYSIDGVSRKAIFFEPKIKSKKTPVVFVFHGHGGNAKFASRRIDFQDYYKEALVIFMEGIPGRTSQRIDPDGKMNGWQFFPGDLGDRDILFFDEVLADILKNYTIDEQKVAVVGHSNGARFVNVLWTMRPEKISAIISVSAQGGIMVSGAKPISIWMSMGKYDPIVPYDTQKFSITIVQKNLLINTEKFVQKDDLKIYRGTNNTELVVQELNAGHEFPAGSIPEMVEFLKRQVK